MAPRCLCRPGSFIAFAQAPAAAAPPGTYSADAHADIIDLDATLLAPLGGSLANVRVGHSQSTMGSTNGVGSSTSESANLDGSALFGNVPLPVDTETVDDGAGGSDVVSRAATTVGDIDLLGGEVTVDVTNPVVLQARSDGTDGSAGFVSPPTILVTVGGEEIAIPLNSSPQQIDLPAELEPIVNLSITAFTPTDQSSDPMGKATLDALFRIDLEVFSIPGPLGIKVADVELAVAPMAVAATAPTGGVECGESDTTAPAATVITTPADGSMTNDSTPPFTGTAEPGSTVIVRDSEGDEVCTAVADDITGAWSCTPTQPLPQGEHTYTATATDGAGNTSGTDSTTFTVVPGNGDTVAPAAPDITSPGTGSTTQDTTPPISGTGETGATVTVREGSTVLCTAVVTGNGTWSCTPTVALPLGQHTVTAKHRQ